MTCKLKLEDVAYFSHEHSKHTVRQLLTGQGRWSSPPNSKIDRMEAEVSPDLEAIIGSDRGSMSHELCPSVRHFGHKLSRAVNLHFSKSESK